MKERRVPFELDEFVSSVHSPHVDREKESNQEQVAYAQWKQNILANVTVRLVCFVRSVEANQLRLGSMEPDLARILQ